MQDAEPKRRASDLDESGNIITVRSTWERAGLAHTRITEQGKLFDAHAAKLGELESWLSRVDRAFLRDDLDTVDYEGHRKDHLHRVEADKVTKAYKFEATKKLIVMLAIALSGALATGVLDWFREHLK